MSHGPADPTSCPNVLEELLGRATHDLRGSLSQVSAFSTLLVRQHSSALPDDGRQLCSRIEIAAKKSVEVLTALEEFMRASEPPNFEMLDAGELVQAALDTLQTQIRNAGAIVLPQPLPTIHGDRAKVLRLFLELLENAIKFRGTATPEIAISARGDGDCAVFSVKDNGIGVPAGKAEAVFEPLRRLHGKQYPGTGIGLAICRRIVELHGGRIWLEPDSSPGTEIRFTLPR